MSTPDTFRAGDSISWSESIPDYLPADGWVLKYRLLWSTGNDSFVATASGVEHAVSLSSAATQGWPAGAATLVRYVEHATLGKITLSSGAVTILPDLTAATSHDGRTRNRRLLDDAEAALAAYLQGGRAMVAEYEIGDRKMKFRSVEEIQKLIDYYRPLVARENAALALLEGGSIPGRIIYRAGKG